MAQSRNLRRRLAVGFFILLLAATPATATAAVTPPPAQDTATATRPAAPVAATTATFRVYAHREGLVGHTTANGHVIQENDRFVALPCTCVLSSNGGDEFLVKIEYKGRTAIAPVWDVGPWNTDDNYWDPPERRRWKDIPQGVPQAAAAYFNKHNGGLDGTGREVRSPAGIDIADGTFWHDLGMTTSDWVTVTFLWLQPAGAELPPLPPGYAHLATVRSGQRPPLDRVAPSSEPGSVYIPQTGHNIPAPIAQYWYAHGGWHTIGLPLTELFREVTADGRARLVQYFERQILELIPQPAGPPIVRSDLIGYAAYAPPQARAPVPPFASSADHWYFPETQHSLSYGFKQYWLAHGGLETFGFPITEEFAAQTPDGRRYVAQIFERARFEWWPDKAGTPEDITQGLLVSELLRQAGWTP
ncbi:MAG: SH3 domain-containing protein [Sphaerobacter sp.]|nr:SH3 domain-containing protein [Sphaerobacter sp.]